MSESVKYKTPGFPCSAAHRVAGCSALCIYLACNLPFIIRYTLRLDPAGGILTAAASIIYICMVIMVFMRCSLHSIFQIDQKRLLIGLGILTAAAFFAMRFVPLTAFTIDRWKIINLFWDSVRAGVYPYGMSTPVGNSLGASPVYFLIAYPAYATGWFELLPLSVPWIWWFGFPRLNLQLRLTGLIFIFASPIFIYEILTRSTLLFNSILIAAFCAWILSVKTWNWKIVILYGILGGLLLNTRTVFGLPIAVAMLYLIRRRELSMRIICTACMMAMTYIAVYVIFALFWSTAEVLTANPLTVQSENLYPPLFMLIMIFIATVGGLVACRKNVLLFGGVCMFIAVAAYIAIQISRHGCQAALLGKESDITYLAFCLPFILPYLTLSKKY